MHRAQSHQTLQVIGARIGIARRAVASGAEMLWEFRRIDTGEPHPFAITAQGVSIGDFDRGTSEIRGRRFGPMKGPLEQGRANGYPGGNGDDKEEQIENTPPPAAMTKPAQLKGGGPPLRPRPETMH